MSPPDVSHVKKRRKRTRNTHANEGSDAPLNTDSFFVLSQDAANSSVSNVPAEQPVPRVARDPRESLSLDRTVKGFGFGLGTTNPLVGVNYISSDDEPAPSAEYLMRFAIDNPITDIDPRWFSGVPMSLYPENNQRERLWSEPVRVYSDGAGPSSSSRNQSLGRIHTNSELDNPIRENNGPSFSTRGPGSSNPDPSNNGKSVARLRIPIPHKKNDKQEDAQPVRREPVSVPPEPPAALSSSSNNRGAGPSNAPNIHVQNHLLNAAGLDVNAQLRAIEENDKRERAKLNAIKEYSFRAKYGNLSTLEIIKISKSGYIDFERISYGGSIEVWTYLSLDQKTGNMTLVLSSLLAGSYDEQSNNLQLSFLETSKQVIIPGLCTPVAFASGMINNGMHAHVVYQFPPRFLLKTILTRDIHGHTLNWNKRVFIICKMLRTCIMMNMNNENVRVLKWLCLDTVWIEENMETVYFTPACLVTGKQLRVLKAVEFITQMFSTDTVLSISDAHNFRFNHAASNSMPFHVQGLIRVLVMACYSEETAYETIGNCVDQLWTETLRHKDIDLTSRPEPNFFRSTFNCSICQDTIQSIHSSAISCESGHWVCKECLEDHVRLQNPHTGGSYGIQKETSRVKCVLPECKSAPYDEKALFRVAKESTISEYQKIARLHIEAETIADIEKQHGSISGATSSSSNSLSTVHRQEHEAKMHAKHIIDNICTLRSGCCESAFFDFDGCTLVKCQALKCKSIFCACCLEKINHSKSNPPTLHVPKCTVNSEKNQFISENKWRQIQVQRRKEKIVEYLDSITDKKVVATVVASIQKDIADIGIRL